ncbi:MAG: prephenate dehydratase [Burkholderiaceae bacterium]|nr:prephenate dehydratase [Burkholderiaceae bacterium]
MPDPAAADANAPEAEPVESLDELRARIDRVDGELLERLAERARLAQRVGESKKRSDAPVMRPEREAQILAALRARNPGPLSGEAIEAIWREIISGCRDLERRLRVAYLGPPGTFSEQAALGHFGSSVDTMACASIDEVFRSVEVGGADFGVVPVENSTEGAVSRTLDLLLQTTLTISGEISLHVRQNLMRLEASTEGIERIVSHAQSLAQCSRWLDEHAHGIERVPVASNAEAARLASLDAATAAIAGERAATRYGLQVVATGIQDDPHNRTRFAVIGKYACAPSGADQTSVILSVPDRAGAVHAMIEPLARHGVSMKRFESRPARQGLWEYLFYIDLIGHRDDAGVAAALREMAAQSSFCRIVGSYPRASA